MKIVRGRYPPIPPTFSHQLSALCAELLHTSPNQRPSARQLLQRPILASALAASVTSGEGVEPPLAQPPLSQPPQAEYFAEEERRRVVSEQFARLSLYLGKIPADAGFNPDWYPGHEDALKCMALQRLIALP